MVDKKVIVNGIEHFLSVDKINKFKSTHSDNTSIRTYEIVYDSTLNQSFFVIPKHTPWIDDRILNDKDTQFDVFVLSEGGDFDASTNTSRHNETRKVLEHFDNTSVQFSDVKHIKSKTEDEWVNIIIRM